MSTISISSINTFNTCRAKYHYRYNDRIVRVSGKRANNLSLGSLIHYVIAEILTLSLSEDFNLYDEVYAAVSRWDKDNRPAEPPELFRFEIDGEVITNEDEVEFYENWESNLDEGAQIAYHFFLSEKILERYDLALDNDGFPLLELKLEYDLGNGFTFVGFVDAVLRDKETGLYYVVDWKTRRSFNSYEDEAINQQIPAYTYVLRQMGYDVSGGIVYQIKNMAPRIPSILKAGTTSRAKINTTWEMYAAAVLANGENPDDYRDEMEPKLATNEFYKPITVTRPDYVLQHIWDNVINVSVQIKESASQPITYAYGFPCKMCSYSPICHSQLMGYDTNDLINTYYVSRDDLDEVSTARRTISNAHS